MRLGLIFCLLLALSRPLLGPAASAEEALPSVSFTNDIAPLLVQKCLSCHGPEKNKGDFRLHTFEGLMRPGSSRGASIVPGQPAASKVYQLLIAQDEDDRMPQKDEPLSPDQIARLKRWIAEGARFDGPDPKAALLTLIPPLPQPDPPATYSRPMPITALAFNADGSELAASGYHEITIWNPTNGILLRRIKQIAQRTFDLAYQPHGAWLAAASGTPGRWGEVKLLDPVRGTVVRTLATASDMMLAVSFNADGTQLAAGGTDNAIRIWNAASGRQERLIEQQADWVMALAFNHAGTLLASASRDKSVRLFDAMTGEMEHSYLEHGDAVFGVAFSSDDKSVYSCGRDKRIHVWSVKDAKKNAQISGFEEEIYRVIVTARDVFSCSADKRVRQHATADKNELVRTFDAADDVVHALAFHPGTGHLAAGTFAGKIHVWNAETGALVAQFIAAPGPLAASAK
jgi:hypothetical protein